MKTCSIIIIGAVFTVLTHLARATQADDTHDNNYRSHGRRHALYQ